MSKRNDLISSHYLKNANKLVKRIIRRVPNNSKALAEEVVQEAYARALKYFRTFNPETNDFDIWFNSILRNTINDCRTVEQEHGTTNELHDNIESDAPKLRTEDWSGITAKMTAAPEKDKTILELFYYKGYTSSDIAEYLGLNHNTIRQIILRFKNKVNDSE